MKLFKHILIQISQVCKLKSGSFSASTLVEMLTNASLVFSESGGGKTCFDYHSLFYVSFTVINRYTFCSLRFELLLIIFNELDFILNHDFIKTSSYLINTLARQNQSIFYQRSIGNEILVFFSIKIIYKIPIH